MLPETSLPVSRIPNPQAGYHCMVNSHPLYTKRHTHDCYECNILLEGCVKNTFEGTAYILQKGDAVFLAPGEAHQTEVVDGKLPKILTLMVMPAEFEACAALFGAEAAGSFCAASGAVRLSQEELNQLETDYHRLYFLDEEKKMPLVRILFCQMMCALVRRACETMPGGRRPTLAHALQQMNTPENMAEGVDALVRLSNLSRGHVYRLMREEYHMTPLQYITQLRMNYASSLLLYSDKDILSIAMEVGYFSVSHFIAQFKKSFGVPPKQYRIKNRPEFIKKQVDIP